MFYFLMSRNLSTVKFETIAGELVRKACMKTRGGSGPSGMDADGWRHILLSKNFGDAPNDLCKAIASVIKKLCTEKLRSNNIEALLASRLIPLDKHPGLRPIGVGEVLRRITGKVVVSVLRKDVIASVGSLQVCVGHDAGCEADVHTMHSIFDEENTEAVLLIDAGNAFNAINRKVLLHNVRIVCPEIATYVYNCYATSARLFIFGGSELKSEAGTTQGDTIAMAVYALSTIPLLLMVLEITAQFPDNSVKMVGYADDFTAGGTVTSIKKCWDTLCKLGPRFGYHPKPSKTWLIVKNESKEKADKVFEGTGVKITTTGMRHLGAVIGSITYKGEYMNEKINIWLPELQMLTNIAKSEPQAAFSCFIAGYKHKFTYFMRTVPNISSLMKKK